MAGRFVRANVVFIVFIVCMAALLGVSSGATARHNSESSSAGIVPGKHDGALHGLKQMADVICVTPGLHSTDGYKPGAIGLNGRSRFNTYGIDSGNTNVTVMVDGFKIIANSQPDFANTVETDVKTYGNGAEVKEAGALINMVTKSGGNDFHGRYTEAYMRQTGSNLTSDLTARGLTVGSALKYYNDVSGDLGGRIVRDK